MRLHVLEISDRFRVFACPCCPAVLSVMAISGVTGFLLKLLKMKHMEYMVSSDIAGGLQTAIEKYFSDQN